MANINVTGKPIVLERPYNNMKEYDSGDQADFKHWRIRVADLLTNADSRIGPFLDWEAKRKEVISLDIEANSADANRSGLNAP